MVDWISPTTNLMKFSIVQNGQQDFAFQLDLKFLSGTYPDIFAFS